MRSRLSDRQIASGSRTFPGAPNRLPLFVAVGRRALQITLWRLP